LTEADAANDRRQSVAARRFLHIAGTFFGRRALLFDRRHDGGRDFAELADRPIDRLDGRDGVTVVPESRSQAVFFRRFGMSPGGRINDPQPKGRSAATGQFNVEFEENPNARC